MNRITKKLSSIYLAFGGNSGKTGLVRAVRVTSLLLAGRWTSDRRSISSGDSFELSALSHSRSLSRTSPLTAVPESSVSGVVSGTVLSNEARSAKGKRKRMPMASSSSEQEEKVRISACTYIQLCG